MLPGTVGSDSDLIAELRRPRDRSPRAPISPARWSRAAPPRGAFSLVLIDQGRVVAVRDPNGFRPLCLGRLDGGWVVASESPALDIIGAHLVRELEPGEMVVIDVTGPRSLHPFPAERIDPTLCAFEFVYFARPDAQLYGRSVAAARVRMGEQLAEQAPLPPDPVRPARPMVMPVPESGVPAAQGFARVSGIPYGDGLGQEPLHRSHLHRPQPGPAQPRRAHEAQPAAGEHRRQAAGRGGRLDRARHHDPRRRRHAAAVGRRRGAPADHVAALPLAVLLRDGHRRPRRAAGRQPDRGGDPPLRRRRLARLPHARPPAGRHRRAGRRLLLRLPDR